MTPEPGCARRLEEAHGAFPEGFTDRLHDAKVTSVRITGDTATVRLSLAAEGWPLESLQRIDGEWLVDG